MSRFIQLALLASVALAVACGEDPASSRPIGSYTAEVTGDLERSLRGAASLVIGSSGYGRPTVSLVLGAEGAQDRIMLVIGRDAPPAAGDYEIAAFTSEPLADKWIGAYLLGPNDPGAGYFNAIGGLVRITHSSANRLRGIFALDAEGVIGEAGAEPLAIVIEGTFEATLALR